MSMVPLNLPPCSFRIRTEGQSKEIFDSLRGKYVALTPEEWVRQHFIVFLRDSLKYPAGLISVEKGFEVNTRKKRADIVVYSADTKPWMVVECKAPSVKLSEEAFFQASSYHDKLSVKYMVVTNGLQHFCCKFDQGRFAFQPGFPSFGD
jgi:hypothetical protein